MVSEFSTQSFDEYDIFTDPRIKRIPDHGLMESYKYIKRQIALLRHGMMADVVAVQSPLVQVYMIHLVIEYEVVICMIFKCIKCKEIKNRP